MVETETAIVFEDGWRALNKGMSVPTEDTEQKNADFPLEAPERTHPCWDLDINLVGPVLGFWPSETTKWEICGFNSYFYGNFYITYIKLFIIQN